MTSRAIISSTPARTLALAASLAVAGGAHAGITTVSGNTTFLNTPPASSVPGALTNFNAFAWDEQQATPQFLAVNMVNNPATNSTAIAGTVSGIVDSHFIHFEGIPGVVGASGSLTFNNPIAGVAFVNLNLDASDGPAGAFGTVYPTTYPFRGLNTTPPSTFSVNGNVLNFNFFSIAPTMDIVQLRVFTQVPAPGALALLGLGAHLAFRRRR